MNKAIEFREIITLNGLGVPVRGTYHRPLDGATGSRPETTEQGRIGVLFLNSLFLPRTATGDSAVYWAESFAECGYPSFRIDLPGLGDTYAPLNTALLDFINAGGYESIISAKINEIVERFCLSGIVIVGHCAGSVSALFAAVASKQCKGVILLDPYFFLPQQLKQSQAWKRLVRWASESRFGGTLSNLYDFLKGLRLSLRPDAPPGNANFPLLHRWKDIATRGTPILLFKAPGRKTAGTKPRVGEFDYLKYLLGIAGRRSDVTVQVIEGTDHSFANRVGRMAVRQHVELWLKDHFSSTQRNSPARALQSERINNRVDDETHASFL
jgi:pimeloyl-ACP methyl ester carboxylesterase